jgi:Arc/MetJ-type ribon-helix-helix transcriptional regulator
MVRTQIQLTEELAAQIKELAGREHASMAEMIRRALIRFLETMPKAATDERYARALAAAGRFRSGRRRLSAEHDATFAEVAGR